MRALELGGLGLDEGAHLLLRRALAGLPDGEALRVTGTHPELAVHLRVWARREGGALTARPGAFELRRDVSPPPVERAGAVGAVSARPSPTWGLAARGAAVEAGGPPWRFALDQQDQLWTDDAARLYAQAAAAQWDPATAIPWQAPLDHPDHVEDAVVQLMTYLIENETAALLVPARFLGQVHPHFREITQVLAVQVADEARHVEVFTRRATLRRGELGLSTLGGQASLRTLFEEADFALASFLLSVLGEGSFLALLRFVAAHAPDAVTRAVCTLAAQDEARHVAFGMAHLERHVGVDPTLRARLALAVERRHEALRHTAGLNAEVFDALAWLAAGEESPEGARRGMAAVSGLVAEMDQGRRVRLGRLGFGEAEASALSALHTRNFM